MRLCIDEVRNTAIWNFFYQIKNKHDKSKLEAEEHVNDYFTYIYIYIYNYIRAHLVVHALNSQAYGRGVARPWTMWKHNRQGVWGRLGPQWVQGKALVGGPGGEAPRPKTDFRQIGDRFGCIFGGVLAVPKLHL